MSVHINEFLLHDDMTPEEIVDAKIADLVNSGVVASRRQILVESVKSDLWKMTYQAVFDIVQFGEANDAYGPFANAMFGGELSPGDMPDEQEWKDHLGIYDWSTSLASEVASELVVPFASVYLPDDGEVDGFENCSTLILHKRTLAKSGVANGVSQLVAAIGVYQDEARQRIGVVLSPVQVFIHEGDLESLEVLGKPLVPLRLVSD